MTLKHITAFSGTMVAAIVFAACGGGSDATDASLGGAGGDGSGGTTMNGTGGVVGGGGTAGTGAAAGTGGNNAATNPIAGTEKYDCAAPSGALPTFSTALVSDGFDHPVLVTHAPDDDGRLFVLEQPGTIKIITLADPIGDSTVNAAPFLDIQDKVTDNAGERGLLGLAFHPDYAKNGLFYVHYSADAGIDGAAVGDTIIEEYKVSSDANVADKASGRQVFHASQPDTNHNGGTIAFGSDGYLYIFLGDGGGGNDQYGNGQKVTSPLGKILRIDPTGAAPGDYETPADNLKQDQATAAPEVWSYGLRNPYRANFDACTGDLYIGDVGQDAYEEVNVTPKGVGRLNYGWPIMEGLHCRMGGCNMTGLTLPVLEHAQNSEGVSAVIGGAVYRGSEIPAARGTYFYADQSSKVFSFVYSGGTATNPQNLSDSLNLNTPVAVQNGGDGEIYFVVFNGDGSNGAIRKLVAQ